MKCPKCGATMTRGAPHGEGVAVQWECHNCGTIVTEPVRAQE